MARSALGLFTSFTYWGVAWLSLSLNLLVSFIFNSSSLDFTVLNIFGSWFSQDKTPMPE